MSNRRSQSAGDRVGSRRTDSARGQSQGPSGAPRTQSQRPAAGNQRQPRRQSVGTRRSEIPMDNLRSSARQDRRPDDRRARRQHHLAPVQTGPRSSSASSQGSHDITDRRGTSAPRRNSRRNARVAYADRARSPEGPHGPPRRPWWSLSWAKAMALGHFGAFGLGFAIAFPLGTTNGQHNGPETC